MDNGRKTRLADMGCILTTMELVTKEAGLTTISMDTGLRRGWMEANTMVCTSKARRTAKGSTNGKTEATTKGTGRRTRSRGMGLTYGQMAGSTKGTG